MRIRIVFRDGEYKLITEAAKKQGVSVPAFIIKSAVKAAQKESKK